MKSAVPLLSIGFMASDCSSGVLQIFTGKLPLSLFVKSLSLKLSVAKGSVRKTVNAVFQKSYIVTFWFWGHKTDFQLT